MIKPDRHTDIDVCVIKLSAIILLYLNKFYEISYDELLNKVISRVGERGRENYPYALNFLFLMGKLEYIKENDSFKYNETK